MPGSKVVVNHQVMLRGAKGHGAIGRSRVLYIANRPGAVATMTEDDLRIRQENERMAKLGYVAYRPGSVPESNAGHALFDAHGVPVRAEVQRELAQTESAIITSVVSVRPEDIEALGLETKQDWERMLRGQWPKYVESLGVMAPEDVRWVAAYHIGDKSGIPHCHIFTWDASGQFDSLLPKQRMAQANDELRSFVMRPQREAISLVRTQARDELVVSMRDIQLKDSQIAEVAKTLPEEGSLKYAKLAKFHPEAIEPINRLVQRTIADNKPMSEAVQRYRSAVLEHGELKGLEGDSLKAHVDAADDDLRVRLGNACIANVRAASGIVPERIDPVPEIDLRTEVLALPAERKQVQALAEELDSCLSPKERQALAAGIQRLVKTESLPKDARVALRKSSTVKAHAEHLASLSAASAQRFVASAVQAAGEGRGDFGDDTARLTEHMTTRMLAKVIFRAIHAPTPKANQAVPKAQLKNIPRTPK